MKKIIVIVILLAAAVAAFVVPSLMEQYNAAQSLAAKQNKLGLTPEEIAAAKAEKDRQALLKNDKMIGATVTDGKENLMHLTGDQMAALNQLNQSKNG